VRPRPRAVPVEDRRDCAAGDALDRAPPAFFRYYREIWEVQEKSTTHLGDKHAALESLPMLVRLYCACEFYTRTRYPARPGGCRKDLPKWHALLRIPVFWWHDSLKNVARIMREQRFLLGKIVVSWLTVGYDYSPGMQAFLPASPLSLRASLTPRASPNSRRYRSVGDGAPAGHGFANGGQSSHELHVLAPKPNCSKKRCQWVSWTVTLGPAHPRSAVACTILYPNAPCLASHR
jgi:hypothetical protein